MGSGRSASGPVTTSRSPAGRSCRSIAISPRSWRPSERSTTSDVCWTARSSCSRQTGGPWTSTRCFNASIRRSRASVAWRRRRRPPSSGSTSSPWETRTFVASRSSRGDLGWSGSWRARGRPSTAHRPLPTRTSRCRGWSASTSRDWTGSWPSGPPRPTGPASARCSR